MRNEIPVECVWMVTWYEGITQAIGIEYACKRFTLENVLDAGVELSSLLPMVTVIFRGFSYPIDIPTPKSCTK